jgi:hypothetical protein
MYTTKSVCLLIIFFLPLFIFAQTWKSTIDLNLIVDDADRIDLYTNKDGNHIIVQTSSQLKYYLYSYAGYQIRSVTIDNSISENPRLSCVTGYLDTVYVLWKEGSYIYGKKTTNAGQNWTNLNNISMDESFSNGLELWAEHKLLHIVWSESEEAVYFPYETYYRPINHKSTFWGTQKQVTDLSGEEGGFPSVTTSPNRIHTSYTNIADYNPMGEWGSAKNRDRYYTTWQDPILILNDAGRSYVVATSSKLHTFYYDSWYEMGQFGYDLYHMNRNFDSISWGTPTLIQDYYADPADKPVDMAVSTNDHLHIAYGGKYYKEWDSSWSSTFEYTSQYFAYTFNQKISANSNDIYIIWIEYDSPNYRIRLRQRDYAPLAPQNLYVEYGFGDHPTVHWDANTEADLKGYHVYRAIPRISENKRLTTTPITATYYVDYEYVEGESYPAYYSAKAVDQYDNLSPSSNSYGVWVMPTKQGQLSQTGTLYPARFELGQNFPNPFNPSTSIVFGLPEDDWVEINIYSVTGQRIIQLVNGQLEKGFHTVTWNGKDGNGNLVSSGIYIYELLADGKRLVDKMFLMK